LYKIRYRKYHSSGDKTHINVHNIAKKKKKKQQKKDTVQTTKKKYINKEKRD
jgi:hypothetical protein